VADKGAPDLGPELVSGAIEAMFDLAVTPDDRAGVLTVGQLQALVLRRVRLRAGPSTTAMAFYRLRRTLQPQGQPALAVTTLTRSLFSGSARNFRRRLLAETGLEIPGMAATSLSLAGYALFLVAFCAGVLALFQQNLRTGIYALAGLALSIALIRLDPQSVPGEFKTLGQFAQHTATLNFQKMAKGGAEVTDEAVWQALRLALADAAGVAPDQITRATALAPD